jgi:hypothetical protein
MGMNQKLKLIPLVVLAGAIAPAAVLAQKVDQKLSISAAPKVVSFGGDLKVTGQLTGGDARDISGQNITLQADTFPYEGKFERLDTADTTDTGAYSFTLKPIMNAKYRTTAKGGVESPEVLVPVKVGVTIKVSDRTPKSGARVRFSGTVAPPHDGKVAQVQRRTSSGWKNLAKVTLVDGGDVVSNYSKRVKITKSGRYRVFFNPADGDHVAGASRKVRITVG